MAARKRARGSSKKSVGNGLHTMPRRGAGGLRTGRVCGLDDGFGDEFDLGFEDDDFGGLGGGHGTASSGSADALMALFDDEGAMGDAFDDSGVGARGFQSSSSALRGAASSTGAQSSSSTWKGAASSTGAQSSSATWRGAAGATGSQSSSSTWMGASAAAGSQSSSSARRPARQKASASPFEAFVDPMDMLAPASKAHKGKKQRLPPEGMFDPLDSLDPMDASLDQLNDLFGDGYCPEDESDDPLLMDSLDDFHDDFPDDFHDDFLSPPRRRRQSAWKLVHRFNPFGRLQLPPVRRRRQGFPDEGLLTEIDGGFPVNSAGSSASAAEPSVGSAGSAAPAAASALSKAGSAGSSAPAAAGLSAGSAGSSAPAAAPAPSLASAAGPSAGSAGSAAPAAAPVLSLASSAGPSAGSAGSAAPAAAPVLSLASSAGPSAGSAGSAAPAAAHALGNASAAGPSVGSAGSAAPAASPALIKASAGSAAPAVAPALSKASDSEASAAGLLARSTGSPAPVAAPALSNAADSEAQSPLKFAEELAAKPIIEEASPAPDSAAAKALMEQPPPPSTDAAEGAESITCTALSEMPQMPRYAFEYFCEAIYKESGEQSISESDLIHRWRILQEEERYQFVDLAEIDKRRFQDEYTQWRRLREEQGYPEPEMNELVINRCSAMEERLAQLEREARDGLSTQGGLRLVAKHGRVRIASRSPSMISICEDKEAGRRRRLRKSKPAGYPEESRSAYKLFCNEYKEKLAGDDSVTPMGHEAATDKASVTAQEEASPDKTAAAEQEVLPEDAAAHDREAPTDADKIESRAADQEATPVVAAPSDKDTPMGLEGAPDKAAPADEDGCQAADAPAESKKRRRSTKGMETMKKLREIWKNLSAEERQRFESMAAADEQRFSDEREAWRQEHPDVELSEAEVESHKRTRKRRRKSRSPKPEGHTRRRKRPPKPEGFPEDPRSAYKIFCGDHSADACFNEVNNDAVPAEGATAEQPRRSRGMEKLKKLREAWSNLPMEERERYEAQAAAEQQRFSEELEAWRQTQPDGGLGAGAEYLHLPRSSKLPRPVGRRPPREYQPPRGGMDTVFVRAAALKRKVDPEEEREKKQSRKSITEVAAEVQDQQDDDEGWGVAGGTGSIDDDLFGLPGDDENSASLPSGTIDWSSAGNSGLPTPKSAPTAMGPTAPREPVDDLLVDFISPEDDVVADDSLGDLAETHGAPQSFGPSGNFEEYAMTPSMQEYAMTPWEESQAPLPWTDTPDTVGAPKVLGPQLCIDETGNIVLNQSSLSKKMEREVPREAEDPDVPVEDVTEYKKAYRRTPATKWTDQESAEFYEALSLYGTDLFLVQTCFRNKSAAQIKAKFTREMKKFPEKVEAALLQNRKKLTADTFERLHGKIDISKHWRPEATPPPGQEPDLPDGSVPGSGDGPMPEEEPEEPAEPEYTEEDESHTTNRLMALFD